MLEDAAEDKARIIEVPIFSDDRGSLAAIEFSDWLPFVPERFYYIWGTWTDVKRGAHAHWIESEAIFAISGGFSVDVDDGISKVTYGLENPSQILVIPPRHWHELHSFQPQSICCVFASHPYNSQDYCRDHDLFLRTVRG